MKQPPLLHAEVYGRGPTVVLLHGFLASSAYWHKVSELVSKNNRVLAIDLLSFGNSPKPLRSKYDYDAHIASINQTLKHYNASSFTLVGHSMGAMIALRYANLYESRVKQLILTNLPVMLGSDEVKQQFFSSNVIYRLGLTPVSHRFMWSSLRLLYKLRSLPRGSMNRLSENKEFVFRHNAVSRLRSFRNIIMDAKTDMDLARVQVKTTVLSGFEDKKIYIENLLHNIQLSPHVALENVNTGHHIPRIMPELLVRRLNDHN